MNKFSNKLVGALVLGTALVAGCGGGGGDSQAEAEKPTTPTDLSVSALFKYIGDLIAGTSDTSEPGDVNGLTLAVDEAAEPTPLN
ncbi:MAG: hypothetical protein Q8K22_14515 [Rhodoferax sp.]|jgi:hypothetical protein|nr:hypothetical protein [Rhodoferax sp.]